MKPFWLSGFGVSPGNVTPLAQGYCKQIQSSPFQVDFEWGFENHHKTLEESYF